MSIKQAFSKTAVLRKIIPTVRIIRNKSNSTVKNIDFDTIDYDDKKYIEDRLNNSNIETYNLSLKYCYESQSYSGTIQTTYKKKKVINELDYFIEMANNFAIKN